MTDTPEPLTSITPAEPTEIEIFRDATATRETLTALHDLIGLRYPNDPFYSYLNIAYHGLSSLGVQMVEADPEAEGEGEAEDE